MQLVRKWLSKGMADSQAPPDLRTERTAFGKSYRRQVPLAAHAEVPPAADRADPVDRPEQQAEQRVASLVPIRYGRMLVSPFTFYRGAALIMTTDLGRSAAHRTDRSTVRGRARVELRVVRLDRATTGLRPQRLRRNAARSF